MGWMIAWAVVGATAATRAATFSDADWSPLGQIRITGALIDGVVNAVAVDPRQSVYVAGSFQSIGKLAARNVAKWDGSDWHALGSGIEGSSVVAAATIGEDVYFGGFLQFAGRVPVQGVARWNGTAWASLGTGIRGPIPTVTELAVMGNRLVVGGFFSQAGNAMASSVAMWDGAKWSALGAGVNGWVHSLAVAGTNLYVGGNFTQAGGVEARNIARWDGTRWWPLGAGVDGMVTALVAREGEVYAAGRFSQAGETTVLNIARWDGNRWASLGGGVGGVGAGSVNCLAFYGTELVAGGSFAVADSAPAQNLARWNGVRWSPMGAGVNDRVYVIEPSGNGLWIGGGFQNSGGRVIGSIARWTDGEFRGPPASAASGVYALAVDDSVILAGGSFRGADNMGAENVAVWQPGWNPLHNGVNGAVHAVLLSGADYFVAGEFTHTGNRGLSRIARWNVDTRDWVEVGGGVDGPAAALAKWNQDVLVGGSFQTAGTVSTPYVARWDGTAWSSLGAGPGGAVQALATTAGEVFAAGVFPGAAGGSVYGVKRWDGTAWSLLGTGMDGPVKALTIGEGGLYAGGAFRQAGGQPARGVAWWDGARWVPLADGVDGEVLALASVGNEVLVGGTFQKAGDLSASHAAVWDAVTKTWGALGSGLDGPVRAIHPGGRGAVFGGEFHQAGGREASGIASLGYVSIGFIRSRLDVGEADATATAVLVRSAPASVATRVTYRVRPVTPGTAVKDATPGIDFQLADGTVEFQPGETAKALPLGLIGDELIEGDEGFEIEIVSVEDGRPGVTRRMLVWIVDDQPRVEFGAYPSHVVEGSGFFDVEVRRAGPSGSPAAVTLHLATDLSTATVGSDFRFSDTRIEFQRGEKSKFVRIELLDDAEFEPVEPMFLELVKPDGMGIVGGNPVRIEIQDNEPRLTFSTPTIFGVSEAAGSVAVDVVLSKPSEAPAQVRARTVLVQLEGEATPGLDYTPVDEMLVFAPGEITKRVTVPILDNYIRDGQRHFTMQLSEAAGAGLGNVSETRVFVENDDLGFRIAGYCCSNSEAAGLLEMVVERAGFLGRTGSVFYSVGPALQSLPTATAGKDFEAVSGWLEFGPGEVRKTFRVPLLNDVEREGLEHFRVVLLKTEGGIGLAAPWFLEIPIDDNERGYSLAEVVDSPDGDRRVRERAGAWQLRVSRPGDYDSIGTVKYRVEALSAGVMPVLLATPGRDFEPLTGTLEFSPKQESAFIPLQVFPDAVIEDDEMFRVVLFDPSPGIPIDNGEAYIQIVEAFRSPARVDLEFQPAIDSVPEEGWGFAGVNRFHPLPDGRFLHHTSLRPHTGEYGIRLQRFLADGSRDASFRPADFPGGELSVVALPSGGAYVGTASQFFTLYGREIRLVARLQPDGAIDPGFTVGPSTMLNTVRALAVAANGDVVLAGYSDALGSYAAVRLKSDGSAIARPPVIFDGEVHGLLALPDGSVLARGWFGMVEGRPQYRLTRLRADGSADSDYRSLPPESDAIIQGLALTPDGPVYWGRVQDSESGSQESTLRRLKAEGGDDPAFEAYRDPLNREVGDVAVAGSTLWALRTEGESRKLIAWRSKGGPDLQQPSLEVQTQLLSMKQAPQGQLEAHPDGSLLLGGVDNVNGRFVPKLAKLTVSAEVPRVELAFDSARVGEGAGRVSIRLIRVGDPTERWTVGWRTEDRTARAGVDYIAANGEVTFSAGESESTVELTLLDNSELDGDRWLRLRFTKIPGGGELPPVEVTIVNDELGFLPGGMRVFPNGAVWVRPTGQHWRRGLEGASWLETGSGLRRDDPERSEWLNPWTRDTVIDVGATGERYLWLRHE